ncbi:hypothetical protein M378DRAFT_157589 [Amanita muscaria Koide BX008]|uniref:Uncharacterized protein n=1 Tax=Amanita muscaria (strain Koide BX008) TaxID=946122 RepID=A0A0C2X4X9_AMAMK|nr:hypothetical protein M378DRAFT_157589 [Amanita muscaria Koide BX008]
MDQRLFFTKKLIGLPNLFLVQNSLCICRCRGTGETGSRLVRGQADNQGAIS